MRDDQQPHTRGLLGSTSLLLPVAHRGEAETEPFRERLLAEAQIGANAADIDIVGDVDDKTAVRVAARECGYQHWT